MLDLLVSKRLFLMRNFSLCNIWVWVSGYGQENHNIQIQRYLIIKRLVIPLLYCNRLHAWWSTQSRLATLLFSLIAHRLIRPQTLRWFQPKDLTIDERARACCCVCGLAHQCTFNFLISFTLSRYKLPPEPNYLISILCKLADYVN